MHTMPKTRGIPEGQNLQAPFPLKQDPFFVLDTRHWEHLPPLQEVLETDSELRAALKESANRTSPANPRPYVADWREVLVARRHHLTWCVDCCRLTTDKSTRCKECQWARDESSKARAKKTAHATESLK